MRTVLLIILTAIISGCTTGHNKIDVVIKNPIPFDRDNEITEIEWNRVQEILSIKEGERVIVTDINKKQVIYQLIINGRSNIESIIFPVSVKAEGESVYTISKGQPEQFEPLVYGRLVPERKDDFAWENNRTAFRIYGPALKSTGEISNGMDFWAKKTEELIIDKWYKNDLSNIASYHTDNGKGLDFYKVGRTLGLGMTAPFFNDTLCLGDNFINYEILDNGPLRITFRLTYEPYFAGNNEIVETRVISLDAYSYFNRVTNIFYTNSEIIDLATGIVIPEENPEMVESDAIYRDNKGIIAYETPSDSINGTIYTAAINPERFDVIKVSNGHYLGINSYKPGDEYSYYAGGGWSKAGFNSFEKWKEFLKRQKEIIDNPLITQIK